MNRLLFLLAFISLAACSTSPTAIDLLTDQAPAHDFPLRTDALGYQLDRDSWGLHFEMEYTFTNRTDRLVSLPNCNGFFGFHLEKKVGLG